MKAARSISPARVVALQSGHDQAGQMVLLFLAAGDQQQAEKKS